MTVVVAHNRVPVIDSTTWATADARAFVWLVWAPLRAV